MVYKDGSKQRMTGHKAIVEAIKNGDGISHAEGGGAVGEFVNALLTEE